MPNHQIRKTSIIKKTCYLLLLGLSVYGCDKKNIKSPETSDIINLKIVKTVKNNKDLNYVVMSNIYPEDPYTMFLTLRGGGISTYNVSDPATPELLTHWDENPARHVEGQDRIGDLLVVTDISRGGLFLFDVSNPANLIKLSYLNLEGIDNVLHVKTRKLGNRMYAFLSGGFHFTTDEPSELFVAVDITDPKTPFFVSKIKTGVLGPEGISIKDNYAYLGGFLSTKFLVIDISAPTNMKIVKTLDEAHYGQMVSEIGNDGILYAALWGAVDSDKGGLAAFDISDPGNIDEINYIFSKDMAKANRVKFHQNYVFMPLEFEKGGGVAIVDKSNPKKLRHVKTILDIPGVSKPYCLALKQDYLYIFGSKANTMVVMQIIKNTPQVLSEVTENK